MRGIEYQAARVAENPNFSLNPETTRDLMKEKSVDLMTGIIKFFNSALLCFCRNFFGMLLSSVKLMTNSQSFENNSQRTGNLRRREQDA